MSEFEGKTVLITECARAGGMGRAIAVAFARAGADLVATDVVTGGTRDDVAVSLSPSRSRSPSASSNRLLLGMLKGK
jgi:NAD(P)-dependent dehydrogenase (short-subunit alcohol dehydrogenase family)